RSGFEGPGAPSPLRQADPIVADQDPALPEKRSGRLLERFLAHTERFVDLLRRTGIAKFPEPSPALQLFLDARFEIVDARPPRRIERKIDLPVGTDLDHVALRPLSRLE